MNFPRNIRIFKRMWAPYNITVPSNHLSYPSPTRGGVFLCLEIVVCQDREQSLPHLVVGNVKEIGMSEPVVILDGEITTLINHRQRHLYIGPYGIFYFTWAKLSIFREITKLLDHISLLYNSDHIHTFAFVKSVSCYKNNENMEIKRYLHTSCLE